MIHFSDRKISTFRDLSHDRNPLHIDPDYASRTFVGQPVVYGILGLLSSLQDLEFGGPVAFEKVSARFSCPVFPAIEYASEVSRRSDHDVGVKLTRGSSQKMTARFRTRPVDSPFKAPAGAQEAGGAPRDLPAELGIATAQGTKVSGKYIVDPSALAQVLKDLGVNPAHVAPLHVSALCWASYLVGMELPGRQALFSSLNISFDGEVDLSSTELKYEATVVSAHQTMNMLEIEATLYSAETSFARAKLNAFIRPEPLTYDLAEFRQVVQSSSMLAGQVAFVSGSSRGLGALIAIGLAMQGSDVVLHYNRNEKQAQEVQSVIRGELGRQCSLTRGDIKAKETWDRIRSEIEDRYGRLDICVNNAYPPILPMRFDELSDALVNIHVFDNIRAYILAHQALVPLVRESEGCVINISSLYAVEPRNDYSHYSIAKSALEGMARALAAGTPKVRFLTVRPPRILTDQTNVPADLTAAASPFGVVATILSSLLTIEEAGHHLIDNFDA